MEENIEHNTRKLHSKIIIINFSELIPPTKGHAQKYLKFQRKEYLRPLSRKMFAVGFWVFIWILRICCPLIHKKGASRCCAVIDC